MSKRADDLWHSPFHISHVQNPPTIQAHLYHSIIGGPACGKYARTELGVYPPEAIRFREEGNTGIIDHLYSKVQVSCWPSLPKFVYVYAGFDLCSSLPEIPKDKIRWSIIDGYRQEIA